MPPNNPLDYDFSSPSITQGPSREAVVAQERALNKTRMAIAGEVVPFSLALPSSETSLASVGGLLGGIAPYVFPEAKPIQALTRMTAAAPSVTRPFIPSLVGSSVGTTAGTLTEQAFNPNEDIFGTETGKKLLGNLIENAVFDVGGNLAVTVAGKTIKVGKDTLAQMGLGKGGLMSTMDPEAQARIAAQEYLSKRGGTLTKGQLTGDQGTQSLEGALSVSSGGKAFEEQRKTVEDIIKRGSQEVRDSLDTSDAFKAALKQGDTTDIAVGDRFQNAVATAEQEMKAKYRPIYQQLEKEGDGLFIDLRPLKENAQAELAKLAKRKYAGAGAERRRALEDIVNQEDRVPLSLAHDLRSDFLAGAREAQKEGVPTTALQREYTMQAEGIQKQMDNVMVATFGNEEEKALARKLGMFGGIDSPAGLRSGQVLNYSKNLDQFLGKIGMTPANAGNNQLLRDYFNAQKSYGEAMQGFYNGTVSAALKQEPSAVGAYLFNTDRPERTRDVFKAIKEVQKYLPADQAKGLNNELMYGFLSKAMSTPEEVLKFSKQLDNPEFKDTFRYLFKDPVQRKQVLDVFNAAKYGFEETPGGTFLRTKLAGAATGLGTTAVAGGALYYSMPDSVKENLNIPQQLAGLSVLYITPKMVSRALTSKQGMDALAGLAKAQSNPKYGGAVGAKIAKQLNDSGIIDFEEINQIDQMIRAQGQQQQSQQPSNAPVSPLDYQFK